MKLSEKQILEKTRLDNLQEVRNLNLWGQELDDISILQTMPSVEVLSLSVNKITSLKDFMYCRKLQELYLRRNDIQNIADLHYLVSLPDLTVLWLSDNPCAETPCYREQVIKALPSLTKLDNEEIKQEERERVASMDLPPLPRPSEAMTHAQSNPNPQGLDFRSPAASEPPRSEESGRSRIPAGRHSPVNRRSTGSPVGGGEVAQPGHRRPPPSENHSMSNSVLFAVLKLLDVLEDEDLQVVRREIDVRSRQR